VPPGAERVGKKAGKNAPGRSADTEEEGRRGKRERRSSAVNAKGHLGKSGPQSASEKSRHAIRTKHSTNGKKTTESKKKGLGSTNTQEGG